MVYVNDKKFACESCIKGHRSSSCHHTDRPLFEIKKKGRPVSQCTKCRELRQSKKVHSKCTCDNNGEKARQEQLVPVSAGSKSRRYIPIVPALPNGLKDALQSAKASAAPADERQRVDSLLNPCNCQDVWNCKCQGSPGPSSMPQIPAPASKTSNPLDALAHAASIRFTEERSTSGPALLSNRKAKIPRARPHSPQQAASRKRSKPSSLPQSELALSPIRIIAPPPSLPSTFPEFETVSAANLCVESGCTCGTQCACPGCVQHRGASHPSSDHKDCGDGCGSCIDRRTTELHLDKFRGIWQASGPSMPSASSSFLDQFFARAAALPPPPSNRRLGIDPTDTSTSLESVALPKLDCCGGACLCPTDGCNCRSSCGGSCLDDHMRQHQPPTINATPAPKPLKSCCAGKRAAAALLSV